MPNSIPSANNRIAYPKWMITQIAQHASNHAGTEIEKFDPENWWNHFCTSYYNNIDLDTLLAEEIAIIDAEIQKRELPPKQKPRGLAINDIHQKIRQLNLHSAEADLEQQLTQRVSRPIWSKCLDQLDTFYPLSNLSPHSQLLMAKFDFENCAHLQELASLLRNAPPNNFRSFLKEHLENYRLGNSIFDFYSTIEFQYILYGALLEVTKQISKSHQEKANDLVQPQYCI